MFTKLNSMLVAAALLSTAVACTNSHVSETDKKAPNTGYEVTEEQYGVVKTSEVKPNAIFYISAESIRVRSTPDSNSSDNIMGRLNVNDRVEVLNSEIIGKDLYVKIKVIATTSSITPSDELYISSKYFNTLPIKIDPVATSLQAPNQMVATSLTGQNKPQANRLFIVTNVATEKIRVYERCLPTENCINRMIFETDVVNGEDDDGTKTNVGFYQVQYWVKFYEIYSAGRMTYPAWYKPGYPDVPAPGNRTAWFQKSYMPNGVGDMRGAFGWYTVFVGPNADGQWTHGTGGWGQDKKDLILFKDSFFGKLANLFTSIRSHGCTRVDNESIAYLRSLIPVGTPLIKIYAKEAYRDQTRVKYSKVPAKWQYILTKNGHQQKNNHQLADRDAVLRAGTPQSEWIEQGTYEVDQMPDAVTGDLYKLGDSAFSGYFIVDEGTVVNYRHPSKMQKGGYSDRVTPDYMISKDPNVQGEPKSQWNNNNKNPWDDPYMGGA